MRTARFQKTIWNHYAKNKRPMPWRRARDRRDPYRILVSEIMLQQTQVSRVVGFYEKFIKKFPDFEKLAQAKTSEVLKSWQGLGYNRRAIALQKLAKKVVEEYGGRLPRELIELESLPGIGPYTAGAIRAFAFNEPEIFIETNIRRVFIHFFFPLNREARGNADEKKIKKSVEKVTDSDLRRYIERTLDSKNPREWYYALMDYGAMLGQTARREVHSEKNAEEREMVGNPNRRSAHYVRQSKFAGSDREIRGQILKILLEKKRISLAALLGLLMKKEANAGISKNDERKRTEKIILAMVREGFIVKNGSQVRIIN